jgi:hypothetical protein
MLNLKHIMHDFNWLLFHCYRMAYFLFLLFLLFPSSLKQSDIFSLLRFIYIVLIYNLVHIICFRNNTKSQNIGKPNNLNIFGSNKTKESKQNGVAFQSYLMFSKEIILDRCVQHLSVCLGKYVQQHMPLWHNTS